MVQAWNLVIEGVVSKLFDREVLAFLSMPQNNKILYWLDDASALLNSAVVGKASNGHTTSYYDYSFMLTPAFKALEYWILNIAPFLGVNEKLIQDARDYGKFNTFLNDESIQKLVKAVSKQLSLKAERSREMRQSLEALNSYLKNLRHTPAHCSSTISEPEKAVTNFHEIVGGINRITGLLIKEGVLK